MTVFRLGRGPSEILFPGALYGNQTGIPYSTATSLLPPKPNALNLDGQDLQYHQQMQKVLSGDRSSIGSRGLLAQMGIDLDISRGAKQIKDASAGGRVRGLAIHGDQGEFSFQADGIQVAASTHKGPVRPEQQDGLVFLRSRLADGAIRYHFAVFDGLSQYGRLGMLTGAQSFVDCILGTYLSEDTVLPGCEMPLDRLLSQANDQMELPLGYTCSAAMSLTLGEQTPVSRFANIGDVRAQVYRKHCAETPYRLHRATRDQSIVQYLREIGAIHNSYEAQDLDPFSNIVLMTMGGARTLSQKLQSTIKYSENDVAVRALLYFHGQGHGLVNTSLWNPGTRSEDEASPNNMGQIFKGLAVHTHRDRLLLASDGLYGYLPDPDGDIEDILSSAPTALVANRLLQKRAMGNMSGLSGDNISIIVVYLNQ